MLEYDVLLEKHDVVFNVTSHTGTNRTYEYVRTRIHTLLQTDNVVVQSEVEGSGYDRIVQMRIDDII